MSALGLVSRELSREIIVGRRAVAAIGVGAMIVCLTLAAYARVYLPFTPVPITLQTFFVLVAGAALGQRLGTLSLASYLLLGTLGLPLFTGVWLGPTTGYLVGFVAAGWLIGRLTAGRATAVRLAVAMLVGTAVVYLFGAAWLAMFLGLGWQHAMAAGVLPFLPGDALKLAAAVAFCGSYRERLRALFS